MKIREEKKVKIKEGSNQNKQSRRNKEKIYTNEVDSCDSMSS